MIKVSEELFAPLLLLFEVHLLSRDYLHMDETTVQVLEEPNRWAWQKSYFWIRVAGTGPPIIRVDYDASCAGKVAERLLSGFRDYLQTDAYSGYNGVVSQPQVVALGCMAHARRRFDAVEMASGGSRIAVDEKLPTLQRAARLS
jgi:hypothetical protein